MWLPWLQWTTTIGTGSTKQPSWSLFWPSENGEKEKQTKQVFRSDADYLVLAGDFNVDPRDGEVRFKDNLWRSRILTLNIWKVKKTHPGNLQIIQRRTNRLGRGVLQGCNKKPSLQINKCFRVTRVSGLIPTYPPLATPPILTPARELTLSFTTMFGIGLRRRRPSLLLIIR